MILSTPFMFQTHACPDDYYRFTAPALEKLLKNNGFKIKLISNLGTGLFSVLFQIIEGTTFLSNMPSVKKLLRASFLSIDALLGHWSSYRAVASRIPLGYFVIAEKVHNK